MDENFVTAQKVIAEAEKLIKDLSKVGAFYTSAIEIDVYEKCDDGETRDGGDFEVQCNRLAYLIDKYKTRGGGAA